MTDPREMTDAELRKALTYGEELDQVFGLDRAAVAQRIRAVLGLPPTEGERLEAAMCGVGEWRVNRFDRGIKYLHEVYYGYTDAHEFVSA